MLDFGAILNYKPPKEEEGSILVGYTVGYAPDQAIQLMYKWCERIDKLIEIDTINNGNPTYRSEKFLEYRGFTLAEYKDLFNQNIEPEEFIHYPAYQQLGISTLTQRERFIIEHEYAEDDYLKALKACNGSEVLDFFLNKFPACIAQKDMFMNSSIIAPPGSGKTFLMKAWLYRLIEKYPQFSFVIIDPHGDVSHDLFSSTIPRDRIAYFDASFYDEGFCFTYNVLDIKDNSPLTQNRTVDQIVAAIADLVTDGADNKMSGAITAVLKQCIYFLIQREGSTISDLYKLVTLDKDILQEAQKYSNYFKDKFIKSEGRSREAVERRVSDLVTGEVPRNILAGESTFDLEKMINQNKVVIFNLADLGELTQIAVGKFILANVKSYARKRNHKDPNMRHTIVAVDECHNFVSGNYEYMLEQLRKYGLHMILANQYLEQLKHHQISVKRNTAVKIFAGESSTDVKGFVEVPKAFLKGGKLDQEGSRNLDIGKFEFLLKVRNKPMMKIKSPEFLLKKKYRLSDQKLQESKAQQLDNYYKSIDSKRNVATNPNEETLQLKPLYLSDYKVTHNFKREKRTLPLFEAILGALVTYNLLTYSQMIDLGLANSSSNLSEPFNEMVKSKHAGSFRFFNEETKASKLVCYATKKGADYIKERIGDNPSQKYFSKAPKKNQNTKHALQNIDAHIAFSLFPLNFYYKDIDGQNLTDVGKVKCDAIFEINSPIRRELFTLEVERGYDSKRSTTKMEAHIELMESGALNEKFNYDFEYKSLWVFSNKAVLENARKVCEKYHERFLFKLQEDDFYCGWVNVKGEKRNLFYI